MVIPGLHKFQTVIYTAVDSPNVHQSYKLIVGYTYEKRTSSAGYD